MTLATSVHIQAPLNYQVVFLKCREIIGIPAEHPFQVTEDNIVWKSGECVCGRFQVVSARPWT